MANKVAKDLAIGDLADVDIDGNSYTVQVQADDQGCEGCFFNHKNDDGRPVARDLGQTVTVMGLVVKSPSDRGVLCSNIGCSVFDRADGQGVMFFHPPAGYINMMANDSDDMADSLEIGKNDSAGKVLRLVVNGETKYVELREPATSNGMCQTCAFSNHGEWAQASAVIRRGDKELAPGNEEIGYCHDIACMRQERTDGKFAHFILME